jgi:hypothetical protein
LANDGNCATKKHLDAAPAPAREMSRLLAALAPAPNMLQSNLAGNVVTYEGSYFYEFFNVLCEAMPEVVSMVPEILEGGETTFLELTQRIGPASR